MAKRSRRFWAWPWELRERGVIGVNARNAEFIFAENRRRFYPRVDDKAITKAICKAHGIPAPETYALVERFGDVRRLHELIRGRDEFVVKPARGAGGRGILVIVSRDGDLLRTADGGSLAPDELRYYVSTILSGLYSLGGRPDRAIIEERLRPSPVFSSFAANGTPDIRVLVYRNIPAMAMLRLPTRESRGRANLHQGAVGVGIDTQTGVTVGGVYRNRTVDAHPDTGAPLAGVSIPQWPGVLGTAAKLGKALGLGYVGVDIVLGAEEEPVVLEANARPGLAIQIANRAGLADRLGHIKELEVKEGGDPDSGRSLS